MKDIINFIGSNYYHGNNYPVKQLCILGRFYQVKFIFLVNF